MNITIKISSTKYNVQEIRDLIIRYGRTERELKRSHPDTIMNIEVGEDESSTKETKEITSASAKYDPWLSK